MFVIYVGAAFVGGWKLFSVGDPFAMVLCMSGLGFAAPLYQLVRRNPYATAMRRFTSEALKRGDYDLILGNRTLVLASEGFISKGEFDEFRCAWTMVSRIFETAEQVLFFIYGGTGIIVPKREFASLEFARNFASDAERLRWAETARRPDPLRAYLAENDASCPRCRYNLRGVTRAICPECGTFLDVAELREASRQA